MRTGFRRHRTSRPLEGRVAVVTGAARGMGASTAYALARRGARVALIGLEEERLHRLTADLPGPTAIEVNLVGSALTARCFLPDLLRSSGYYLQLSARIYAPPWVRVAQPTRAPTPTLVTHYFRLVLATRADAPLPPTGRLGPGGAAAEAAPEAPDRLPRPHPRLGGESWPYDIT
ncbi:SDR family NAD(P)-dependent oxidoreductase [Streptomyces sp. adm13(2018)]|uniref:SDR family NAD(P)-dependent oxidoreductase n=1 Tax=Streptomyces sp. adm13(2018) TaxID=2479007 RepID=UPI0011CDDF8D|nr:SDR family NAD(P)-dependent oxidoreductase [Streptomyces sp. adm13(2018)]TXS26325.1 SDR family NAD(P)-dependent oxidoreductase [Streptomyces sp. adm13(2018)]